MTVPVTVMRLPEQTMTAGTEQSIEKALETREALKGDIAGPPTGFHDTRSKSLVVFPEIYDYDLVR